MSIADRPAGSSYDRTSDVSMSSSHIVGLIARREILTRLKDKGFILSSIFIIVLIMGSVVFQVLIQSGADSVSVGVTGGPQQLSEAIREQADAFGLDAEVTEYDDEAAARQAVEDEEIGLQQAGPAEGDVQRRRATGTNGLRFAKDAGAFHGQCVRQHAGIDHQKADGASHRHADARRSQRPL